MVKAKPAKAGDEKAKGLAGIPGGSRCNFQWITGIYAGSFFIRRKTIVLEQRLQYCSTVTGDEEQEVGATISSFLDKIAQELSEGHAVDSGACFGIFTVKLRTEQLQPGSPRTRKAERYHVVFREKAGFGNG